MIAKPRYFKTVLISVLILLISLGYGHKFMASSAMPNMTPGKTTLSQCQSSCGTSFSDPIVTIQQPVDPQNKEPYFSEPYYLGYMVTEWSLALALCFYLVWHLRWKPPDLTTLYAVYRI